MVGTYAIKLRKANRKRRTSSRQKFRRQERTKKFSGVMTMRASASIPWYIDPVEHFASLGPKVQHLWNALGKLGSQYLLIGGTAIAYQLGHRQSFDIDIVTSRPLEHPRVLRKRMEGAEVGKHKWIRRQPDHYIKFFETKEAPKIDFHGKDPRPCIEAPAMAGNGLRLASLTDLLYLKMIALAARTEDRDAQDALALMQHTDCNVDSAIAALIEPPPVGLDADDLTQLLEKLKAPDRAGWINRSELAELGQLLATPKLCAFVPTHSCIEGGEDVPRLLLAGEDEPSHAMNNAGM